MPAAITHALITAAGRGFKPYPAWDTPVTLLQPLIDSDGVGKPVLQILCEEAFAIGVAEVVLVVAPGDEEEYRHGLGTVARTLAAMGQTAQADALSDLVARLRFVVQERPLGFGHAVWTARHAIAGNRFLLLLSDHLFMADGERRCAPQLLAASEDDEAISSVMAVPEHRLNRYGVVGGHPLAGRPDCWRIERVVEKPTPTAAERELEVAGVRRGHYLAFAGMHLLPRQVFALLDAQVAATPPGTLCELSPVLDQLARERPYVAFRFAGWHQDIGVPYGLWEAQLERALRGPDRDRVLGRLVQAVATSGGGGAR